MLSQLLKPIKAVFKSELQKFIHKDFHELVQRMTVIDTFLFLVTISFLAFFFFKGWFGLRSV